MKEFDTAIIIAGGKSTRMGFDKAFMRIGHSPCIEIIVKKLKRHFNEIIIVTDEKNKYSLTDVTITQDKIKNAGPLGGLHAGLKESNSIYNYLIACDMPVISDKLITYMKEILILKPQIIACENKGFIEPFHAVYSKQLTSKIEEEIKKNEYSLYSLMLKSNTEIIGYNIIKKICENSNIFTNLNTRQELEQFRSKEVDYTSGCFANS